MAGSSLNNIYWICLDQFVQSMHSSKLWKPSFRILLNKQFESIGIPAGVYYLLSSWSWLRVDTASVFTAHSVKFKYSLSQPALQTLFPIQRCQTATVNHALFLLVRSGTESGGVGGGGGGNR